MKKRFLTFILTICAILACVFGFSACDQEHTHQYVAQNTTNATCMEKGLITYTCSCGEWYTAETPALGHNEETHQAQAPTCTEIGWEEYITCEREGCGYSTYEEIPATGIHTYENSNECSVCGYIDTQYFTFTLLGDDTYFIKATDVNNMPARVVIPSVFNDKEVTRIGARAFYECDSLTSVVIPNSVTRIGFAAFDSCRNLTSVVIGDSVTSIGDGAFDSCSNLTNVYITDIAAWCNISFSGSIANPLYCGKNLYLNNELITELVIPNSVTTISNCAFSGCDSLTSVVIPNSVASIGRVAFEGCSRLTNVDIPDSVTSIGQWAFQFCGSLTNVYITDIAAWCNISFGDSTANPLYWGKNLYLNNELITELVIPNSVTTIGSYVFYGCDGLTSVEIGNSVTTIGGCAFCECDGLTSVEIGNSVTSIGDYAFFGCDSLTSVVIGDSVTSIGSLAFYRCYRLVEVVNQSTHITVAKGDSSNGYVGYYALAVYNSGDAFTSKLSNDNGYIVYTDGNEKILVKYNGTETHLTLPSYITKINQYAFYSCSSLTSVEIPDSVTSIGVYAFYECRSLTSVYYKGTESAWDVISIGSYNDNLTSAIRYYYSGSEPTTAGNYWRYNENGEIVVW